MRDYELALVIDPDLTVAERKKQITKIKKIIEELKGKVSQADEWGKRELAYPISKKNLGYYFLLSVKLPVKPTTDLEKKLKLQEKLMRYLLVRKE